MLLTILRKYIKVRCAPTIFPKPRLLFYSALTNKFGQGPLYCRAGKSQILCHGANGVPALAILVCPVMEVHQHQLGPGAQL